MIEEVDHVWMDSAIQLAQRAGDLNEVPVGAVVVLNDKIIGEGFNQVIRSNDPSAHAEVLAIRDAARRVGNYRIPGASLYVTIEPCTMCLGAIIHARIASVVFGATEPKAGVLISYPYLLESGRYNHLPAWRGGIQEVICTNLMQDFFQRRRQEKRLKKNETVNKKQSEQKL